MNPIARVLYEAAADVERRGVTRSPEDNSETCAGRSIHAIGAPFDLDRLAFRTMKLSTGCPYLIPKWNDAQPSRAVVAAEMRSAAELAALIGDRL